MIILAITDLPLRHVNKVGRSYLNKMSVSQLQVVKHGCVISIQIHQVFMATLFCDAPLSHKNHFIAVRQVLLQKNITVYD